MVRRIEVSGPEITSPASFEETVVEDLDIGATDERRPQRPEIKQPRQWRQPLHPADQQP
jgi:hypothetical protein